MSYPKQIYDAARAELARRREKARSDAVSHREEIKRSFPEVEDIQRRITETWTTVVKSVAASPERAAQEINRISGENLSLQQKREELLKSAGYPADYLREHYSCVRCEDTGYVGASMCGCLKRLLRDGAQARLCASAPADACAFERFTLSFYAYTPQEDGAVPRKRMEEVYNFCRDYANSFSPGAKSLLLMGRTGLGKTHLSLAIAGDVTELGFGVVYASAQQLMDRLEAEKFSRSQDDVYRENLETVLTCDLLILDDLGAEFTTSFTASALYNIVNTRLIERRTVIISTNLELADIEKKYGQRMTSRLSFEYKILKFYGKDIRYLKRVEKVD